MSAPLIQHTHRVACAVAAAAAIVFMSVQVHELDQAGALNNLYGLVRWSPSVANQPVGVQRLRTEALWRHCLGGDCGHLWRDTPVAADLLDDDLAEHNVREFGRGGCAVSLLTLG